MLIKSLTKKISLDLNTDSESELIIVSGNEFQTVGTEQQKARLANTVLVNGLFILIHIKAEMNMYVTYKYI